VVGVGGGGFVDESVALWWHPSSLEVANLMFLMSGARKRTKIGEYLRVMDKLKQKLGMGAWQ
jgi:hypothetical protein